MGKPWENGGFNGKTIGKTMGKPQLPIKNGDFP